MYVAGRRPAQPGGRPTRSLSGLARAAPNVALLGLTSLITDMASEMVASVLPLYLTARLGLGALGFGAADGALQILAAVTALAGAVLADRWRRYREAAGAGYALSAVSRFGLLAAGGWLPVLGWLGADRVGKGLRTAPRDALLSMSAPRGRLVEAFGLHRALDTAGALIGPLLAVALLSAVPGSYSTVFAAAFLIAVVGLAVLVLFVRDAPSTGAGRSAVPRQVRGRVRAAALWGRRDVRRLLAVALLLSLPAVSDSLLFLTLRHRTGVSVRLFPSLYVIESVCYLVLAVPAGRLADRVGAGRVLLGGQVALAGCFAVLAGGITPAATAIALPVLLGAYYAATDGVLAALTSQLVPPAARATGLALVGLVLAAGRALAGVGYGAAWSRYGPGSALTDGLAAALLTGALAAPLLLRSFEQVPAPAAGDALAAGEALAWGAGAAPALAAGEPPAGEGRQTRRRAGARLGAFAVLVVVCAGGVVGVTVRNAREQARAARVSAASWSARQPARPGGSAVPLTVAPATLLARRHLLVLDAAEGPGFGRVEAVDPARPGGPRAPTALFCDRVDQRAGRGLCLTDDRVRGRAGITVFDDRLRVVRRLPADGLPSRTRVAPDGRIGAATTFVVGDAYNVDSYSTRTVLVDLVAGRVLADLENFSITRGGHGFHAVDENFWGVTFAGDSDTFYATMHTGQHFYLIRGHARARRAEILRDGVECPSLSPDGTRIAYKARIEHGFAAATWRLHVLTLATGADHPLADTRSVDDQATWLDNGHLSYAVVTDGAGLALADTVTVPADGTGAPRLLVPAAQSAVMVDAPRQPPLGGAAPSGG
ncbi:MFS transporter [Frankia sp. AgB32]|uniref:MFS transporter n=1 Tax=Frankia sp. AgB32 TaxID=631119 RepID=UPI0024B20C06|nr:MFS transporter [Frankia sp. AgB32]